MISYDFCYKGKLNGKDCFFKINTGSDVSIINKKFLGKIEEEIQLKNCFLCYPTGERIPVKSKVRIRVQIGEFSEKISMYVAEINDKCLLGEDFLKIIKLGGIFDSAFENGTGCQKVFELLSGRKFF